MSKKIAILALHPIMYQTPIFRELSDYTKSSKEKIEVIVYFADDISLKNVFFKEFNVFYKPKVPSLIKGFDFKFLKNYSYDSRKGFLSRINPGIFNELIENNYDAILIHGYDTLTSWFALLAAKLTRTKVIFRGEAVLRGNENTFGLKNLFKRVIIQFFFSNCDAYLYSCTGNLNFISFYGVCIDKMFKIPCAVNNDFFTEEFNKYQNLKDEIRNSLKIPNDNLVVLFSARFTERKRPFDLINAIKNINNKNITLLFVGDGPERGKMEKNIIENNINARFTGFVNQDEISKYYTIADLFTVISDYDPSPKAMNEAMNFKLPIISTNVVGTASDLIEDGINGFIIGVGEIDALSRNITKLNEDRLLLKTMGEKSFLKVKQWNYKADVLGIINALKYVTDGK